MWGFLFDPVVNFGIAPKAQAKPMPKSTTGFDSILAFMVRIEKLAP